VGHLVQPSVISFGAETGYNDLYSVQNTTIIMIELQSCPVLNSAPPTKNVLHGRGQAEIGQQNFPSPFS